MSLSLLVLEQTLRNKVDSLSREKHDRLKVLKKYSAQDQALCDVLCITPYYIPSGSVPSKQQLEDLEKHIAASQTEKVQYHCMLWMRSMGLLGILWRNINVSCEKKSWYNIKNFMSSSNNTRV